MTCDCALCRRIKKVRNNLVGLSHEQAACFNELHDLLLSAELDLEYNKAVIGGQFPNSDEIIGRRRAGLTKGYKPKLTLIQKLCRRIALRLTWIYYGA